MMIFSIVRSVTLTWLLSIQHIFTLIQQIYLFLKQFLALRATNQQAEDIGIENLLIR